MYTHYVHRNCLRAYILSIAISSFAVLSQCQQPNISSIKNKAIEEVKHIPVGNSPGSVETADFNGDKIPDLAVTSESDSTVTILLGHGDGSFKAVINSPFYAGPLPNDLVIKDFNRDGNMDLAFANHEEKYITVLLGTGNGNFTPSPHSPFPVDVLPHVHGVASGDFNGDGRSDLVTDSWANDQVAVYFGDSTTLFRKQGLFLKVGIRPYQRHRVADINKDGTDDIITTNLESNNATVLLSDGKGGFNEAAGSPFACGDAPFGLAIGDINADSMPDLVIVNSPSSTAESKGINGMTVMLGNGKGAFTRVKGSPFAAGKIPNRIAIGDIDGDGVNDIIVSDNDSDKIYLYRMSATGNISAQSTIKVGNHPKGIVIIDLNKDGKGDIVVCNQLDNTISILLSD